MKKILIPAILAGIILVAGFVALMPVQKAQTVHNVILAALQGATNANLDDLARSVGTTSVVFDLKGVALPDIDMGTVDTVDPGEFKLIFDSTPTEVDVHVALVVPCDGVGTADADPEYTVVSGIAPALAPLISSADIVVPLSTAGSADDTYDGICTYHVTTAAGDITDIALIQATGLPGNGDGTGEADDTALADPHSVTIFAFIE
ncbi:MAG: hypothetical protein ACE5KA_05965 [Nitrososphaerales archaeon]